MTFLDKARSERKEKEIKFGEDGFPIGCPEDYGYEKVRMGCSSKCEDCWNREMPNTETKEEKNIKIAQRRFYSDRIQPRND